MITKQGRSLGFWRSWSLVVGGVIGSAIFMMPTIIAPYGGLGLVSWAISAAGAIVVAMSLAILARRIPRVGGPYAYAHAGFGDFGGFLVAWGYWIALWSACAAIAIGFVAYLGVFFPALSSNPTLSVAAGLMMIWSLVAINIKGMREAGIFSLLTTIAKLVPLLAIAIFGLFYVEADVLPVMNPTEDSTLSVLGVVAALTFWTFMGLEAASVPADDVIEPEKTIPRALIYGVLTVTVIYLLSGFVVMGVVPSAELAASTAPFAEAATRMVGNWGGLAIAAGAIVSTLGALHCAMLCCSQSAMAAAKDGLFPARFQRMTRQNTPAFSLIMVGILASILMAMSFTRGLVGAYTFILLLATMTNVLAYAFAALAALIVKVPDGAAEKGRRMREGAVAFLAFLICMGVIASSGAETVYWGFLLLMAGFPVYVIVTRNRKPSA